MKKEIVIERGKKFWDDNEHKIKPVFNFTSKIVKHLAHFSQLEKSPTVANYLDTAFQCKDAYTASFTDDGETYFLNKKWEPIFSHELWPVMVKVLEEGHADRIESIKKEKSSNHGNYVCNLGNGLKVGWKSTGTLVQGMHVSTGRADQFRELMSKTTWKIFKTNCIAVGTFKHNWETFFSLNGETGHAKFVDCSTAKKYSTYLKRYREKGMGRSILFYGPPGSGKSNIVKAISNSLNMNTLRLHDLTNVRNRAIAEMVEIFNPDVIILEDIDHLYKYDSDTLLEKIENFNARGKYVLATANELEKIDGAVIRPGRFDEMIEIMHLDADALNEITTDPEIVEIVKDFPVAFIVEVMKRIEILGKEETLKNIEDIKKRIDHKKKEDKP